MGFCSIAAKSFQERVCTYTLVCIHVFISPKRGTSTSAFGLTPAILQAAAVQIMFLALR